MTSNDYLSGNIWFRKSKHISPDISRIHSPIHSFIAKNSLCILWFLGVSNYTRNSGDCVSALKEF